MARSMGLLTRLLFAVTSPGVRRFVHDRVLPARLATELRRQMGFLPETSPNIERLSGRLWGGFSADAAAELSRLAATEATPAAERAGAHFVLSTFYVSLGDHARALQHAEAMARFAPAKRRLGRQLLLEADCLQVLGRKDEARALLERALDQAPFDHHLRLVLANTWASFEGPRATDDDEARLAEVNRIYTKAGLSLLAKRNSGQPLSLDNLGAVAASRSAPGPLVSILMPAYAAETTLSFAVRSVLEQTWQELELLIVDDRSPDGTFQVAEELARHDSRVRVLRLPENRGAYVARNVALSEARGELVTVHDADDWSHPQKLELQVQQLLSPRAIGTTSDWVRCFRHLYFRGNTPPTSSWVTWNVSSLLVRTEHARRLGGWDEVRVGADSEFKRRLEHRQGKGALLHTHSGVPLSFALDADSSLTRSGATHVTTTRHGIRKTYHDAARYWLTKQPAALPRIRSTPRSFPAPLPILPERQRAELDVLVVAELLRDSSDFDGTWALVSAATRAGLRVGVVHWPGRSRTGREATPDEVLDRATRGELYVVSPGEDLGVQAVVVTTPLAFTSQMDRPPVIRPAKGVFWASPSAALLAAEEKARAEEVFVAAFGVRPTWVTADAAELAGRLGRGTDP